MRAEFPFYNNTERDSEELMARSTRRRSKHAVINSWFQLSTMQKGSWGDLRAISGKGRGRKGEGQIKERGTAGWAHYSMNNGVGMKFICSCNSFTDLVCLAIGVFSVIQKAPQGRDIFIFDGFYHLRTEEQGRSIRNKNIISSNESRKGLYIHT